MPPIAHRLVADVDTTFEQDVFDLAQRQRIADVQHHRETDDLGRAVKITKGMVHYHRLREVPFHLNPIFSDNAVQDDDVGSGQFFITFGYRPSPWA